MNFCCCNTSKSLWEKKRYPDPRRLYFFVLLNVFAAILAPRKFCRAASTSEGNAIYATGQSPITDSHAEMPLNKTARMVIVINDGCPKNLDLPEELIEHCVEVWKNKKESRYEKLQRIKEGGCSILPAFRKDCAHLEYKASYITAFRRIVPYLHDHGWSATSVVQKHGRGSKMRLREADIVIASLASYEGVKKMTGAKASFVLIASNDAATIPIKNRLHNPDVKALVMHTSFAELRENNEMLVNGRRHVAWLKHGAAIHTESNFSVRSHPISDLGLKKVVTMVPQIQRWSHPLDCGGGKGGFVEFGKSGFNEVSDRSFAYALDERPIDIAFAGVVHTSGRDKLGIGEHRSQAIAAIRRLGAKHKMNVKVFSHDLDFNDYVKLLRKSKMFVSPFGIGEFSGKDYEIIMAGAVLIKPMADHLEAYPNIYRSDIAIGTKVDFSDLETKCMHFLQSSEGINQAQKMVDRGRELLRVYRNPAQLARDMDSLLSRIFLQSLPANNSPMHKDGSGSMTTSAAMGHKHHEKGDDGQHRTAMLAASSI